MRKRYLALGLTAFLTLSALTACSGTGQNTDAASSSTEIAAQAAGAEEAEDTESAAAGAEAEAAGDSGKGEAAEGAAAGNHADAPSEAAQGATQVDGTGAQQSAKDKQPGATGTQQGTQSGNPEGAQQGAKDTQAGAAGAQQGTQSGNPEGAQQGAQAGSTAEASQTAPTAPHTVAGRPESNSLILQPGFSYTLESTREVDGRQGIACENGEYWVSGSTSLTHYDKDWKQLATNTDPFKGFKVKVNHIGDIDVYKGEIYVGAENFNDGAATDIQIAVYDAQTLQMTRSYMFNAQSGQQECSGLAVDPDTQSIWMCSWVGEESGRYLYRYSLETGEYIGKIHLQAPPQWLQGVAYYNGYLYMTADDGTADLGEPDHIYRWRVDPDSTRACVTLERTLDDVAMVGEIEGLSFDKTQKKLLVSHNRGAQIVLGMPKGLYEGYDREISEVYVYSMARNAWPADYGRQDLWVSRPDEAAAAAAQADVFLVLPTVNLNTHLADNEDVTSLRDAIRFVKTFNMEKGIFGENTAVYAPYYRQWMMGVDLLPEGEEKERYKKVAREDVSAAFEYYLDNCHKEGRPIVLFGYSQGAEQVKDLLLEFGQDPRLSGNLAAAYVIGYPITQADVDASPWLKMAQGETDTGVIISYECMDPSAVLPQTRMLSINPLNWKTDSTEAPKESNRGYVATDTYGNVREEIPAFCGGYLEEKSGVMILTGITDPETYYARGLGVVPDGSYHFYDLIFFYNNLKENVAKRISAFISGKTQPAGTQEQQPAAGETPAAGATTPAGTTGTQEQTPPAGNAQEQQPGAGAQEQTPSTGAQEQTPEAGQQPAAETQENGETEDSSGDYEQSVL